jgi:hypothetical protein
MATTANWFQTRRFLCEFPIGSYVKLSSALGAILFEGPNRRKHSWTRTIQNPMGNSHKNLLFRNQWANSNQTLVEWSLADSLPKMCPVIPTSNQDVRDAKDRKRGIVWLQLSQWVLKRRLLCEFPIGFYVKLSSAVGVILVEGPNRSPHFWKRTIQ